jgi:hypothetical protein
MMTKESFAKQSFIQQAFSAGFDPLVAGNWYSAQLSDVSYQYFKRLDWSSQGYLISTSK